MKKLDDMRPVGAVVCMVSGLWALIKGIPVGDWLRAVGGFALVVVGFIVALYFLRERNSIG